MTEHAVILNNGVKMPILGLGVFKTTEKGEMQTAVHAALQNGYRAFDTAQLYKNEALLAEALRGEEVPRNELFITSKVDVANMGYEKTLASFYESLEKMQLDYFDLFLVHWPGQQKERVIETWRALEKIYHEKKVRAIGVSNFLPRHLEWILENCEIKPTVNQYERNPLNVRMELGKWCMDHEIQPEAWAPLLRGNLDHPVLLELAHKYEKTAAQIVLRWDLQSNYVVIPKSANPGRIAENAGIFDFELGIRDMEAIDALDIGRNTSWDPETYDF